MKLFDKKTGALIIATALLISMGNFTYAETNVQKKKKVEQERVKLRQMIQSLSVKQKQQIANLSKNQQKLEVNRQQLKQSQNRYAAKQENIISLQKDLNSSINQYNKRQNLSAQRIRFIYKTKHSFVFDLLLSSDSISKFMDRIYYQNLIIKSDKERMKELKDEAQNIANKKQRLEREKRELAGIINDIDREKVTIEKTITLNKQVLDKIAKDKKAYERAEQDLKRQSDKLAALINRSTKNSKVVVSGKGFILPVHGRVTSPFGYRIHPIFKSKIFHSGIDYAVPMGTPIRASNSGRVIFSGWQGGYGKVVIIDHGNCTGAPTTTLYAHMSQQKVSVGQMVSQGQIIGLSGSTGYSTGPHCHFEVRINGKPQDPRRFL